MRTWPGTIPGEVRIMARCSSEHGVGPFADPGVAVAGDLSRWQGQRLRRHFRELRERLRQLGPFAHREHEHLEGHVLLEALRQQEVDELLRRLLVFRTLEDADELDLAEARVEQY